MRWRLCLRDVCIEISTATSIICAWKKICYFFFMFMCGGLLRHRHWFWVIVYVRENASNSTYTIFVIIIIIIRNKYMVRRLANEFMCMENSLQENDKMSRDYSAVSFIDDEWHTWWKRLMCSLLTSLTSQYLTSSIGVHFMHRSLIRKNTT